MLIFGETFGVKMSDVELDAVSSAKLYAETLVPVRLVSTEMEIAVGGFDAVAKLFHGKRQSHAVSPA